MVPSTIDVAKAIADVLSIETEVEPGLSLVTVEGELKQASSNLTANAIDASHEGGAIRIRTRVSTHLHPQLRISVADTGTGIAKDVQARLFTAFFTTKEQVGTGLGLWTTKNLMEKRGGHIRMRSRAGTGTVMSLFLPIAS